MEIDLILGDKMWKKIEPLFWIFLIVVAIMTVYAVKVAYGF